MLDQSREFNMPACLLDALASGSFARLHCDVFHFFFYTMFSIFFLHDVFPFFWLQAHKQFRYVRCSFYFHVDSNRATADASNERRLSASRDIRSIRIAITVPCQ